MNRKYIKIIIFILLSLSLGGCPMDHFIPEFVPAVYLKNESRHDIVVYWNSFYSAYYPPNTATYPDTMLPKRYFYAPSEGYYYEERNLDSTEIHNPLLFIVGPGEMSHESCFDGNPLESLYASLPHDTLSVFVLHADTVRKYSWDEIRDDYKVLVRYDLSKEDVKSFDNYTIPFPPTEAMRNMKMWPPFEKIRKIYE